MSIIIEDRELKKLVNSLVVGVLKNLGGKTKVADREGFEKSLCLIRKMA